MFYGEIEENIRNLEFAMKNAVCKQIRKCFEARLKSVLEAKDIVQWMWSFPSQFLLVAQSITLAQELSAVFES